jgi:hypothetical protein
MPSKTQQAAAITEYCVQHRKHRVKKNIDHSNSWQLSKFGRHKHLGTVPVTIMTHAIKPAKWLHTNVSKYAYKSMYKVKLSNISKPGCNTDFRTAVNKSWVHFLPTKSYVAFKVGSTDITQLSIRPVTERQFHYTINDNRGEDCVGEVVTQQC